MSNGYNPNSYHFSTPYITLQEFKDAPTGIEIDNLVSYAFTQAQQDAELFNVINRASSWIDTYCNQVLEATTETETSHTARFNNNGDLIFHPKFSPIIALTSLSYGSQPGNLLSITDCSKAWLENSQIILPYASIIGNSSQGPLQFGSFGNSRQKVYINYTYVNGYTNTTIVSATGGTTSLTVADGTGIIAGQQLKIYDGASSELVTVSSTYVFGSTTVPLVFALGYTHVSGISISGLPGVIKEACILYTVALLKSRGDSAMVMRQGANPGEVIAVADKGGSDISMAKQLLNPYKRVY